MPVAYYASKPVEIQAVQLELTNLQEIAAWSSATRIDVDIDDQRVSIYIAADATVPTFTMDVGDWIVKDPSGGLSTLTTELLATGYNLLDKSDG